MPENARAPSITPSGASSGTRARPLGGVPDRLHCQSRSTEHLTQELISFRQPRDGHGTKGGRRHFVLSRTTPRVALASPADHCRILIEQDWSWSGRSASFSHCKIYGDMNSKILNTER